MTGFSNIPSMTSKEKGDQWEKEFSLEFHRSGRGIPFLVSSLVLKTRGGGQVDFARMEKRGSAWWICLVETKWSKQVSRNQGQRLRRSGEFLGTLLHLPVDLRFVAKNPSP